MSPNRNHPHPHLFYYTKSKVADLILRNKKLRWSRPDQFNDPYDHAIKYKVGFDSIDLKSEIRKISKKVVVSSDAPAFVRQTSSQVFLVVLRAKYLAGQIAKAQAELEIDNHFNGSINLIDHREQVNRTICDFLNDSRVLCLTPNHRSSQMWAYYGENHQGAMFRFNCSNDIDHNFLLAREVEYVSKFPDFLSLEELAEDVIGLRDADYEKMGMDLAFMKHKDWGHEKEYRVHIPYTANHGSGKFTDIPLPNNIFSAMYLGCKMKEPNRTNLINTARLELPHIKIYQAKKMTDSFRIEYDLI